MLPGSPQPTLFRPGPATRNGLSLACNSARFHEPHSKVNGPDLLLRRLATCFPARSALPLHCRTRFAPASAASLLLARCSSAYRSTDRFSDLHFPLGILAPAGSKRSTGSAACRPAFRIRPISSRSPPPFLFQSAATDHRSWLATFPEACCSSNLLEPSSLCSRTHFPSTLF